MRHSPIRIKHVYDKCIGYNKNNNDIAINDIIGKRSSLYKTIYITCIIIFILLVQSDKNILCFRDLKNAANL